MLIVSYNKQARRDTVENQNAFLDVVEGIMRSINESKLQLSLKNAVDTNSTFRET